MDITLQWHHLIPAALIIIGIVVVAKEAFRPKQDYDFGGVGCLVTTLLVLLGLAVYGGAYLW